MILNPATIFLPIFQLTLSVRLLSGLLVSLCNFYFPIFTTLSVFPRCPITSLTVAPQLLPSPSPVVLSQSSFFNDIHLLALTKLNIAEYDASRGTAIFVLTNRTIMARSKKHAQGDVCKDDAVTGKESRVTKVTKRSSTIKKSPTPKITKLPNKSPSQKEHYDKAFPAHIVVHKDSPAYIMAQTYITTYGLCLISILFNSC